MLRQEASDTGSRRITEKQLDDSRKLAFQTAILVSKISFDKHHRHAVRCYGFVCDSLCSHGNTAILTKPGKAWKITRQCAGWVSQGSKVLSGISVSFAPSVLDFSLSSYAG